jgi:hypothetical protein
MSEGFEVVKHSLLTHELAIDSWVDFLNVPRFEFVLSSSLTYQFSALNYTDSVCRFSTLNRGAS